MPDKSTTQAILNFASKKHTVTVNAVVAIVSASIAGGALTFTQPKPLSEEQMKSIVSESISKEVSGLDYRIKAVETVASDAKAMANDNRKSAAESMALISRSLAEIREGVARIDERTKKAGL